MNTVTQELTARARLFAAIEGGSSFWSREVFSNGAIYVLDRALNGDMTQLNTHVVLKRYPALTQTNYLKVSPQLELNY